MKAKTNIALMLILTLLLSACGKNKFTIDGTLEGSETHNLRLIYYANDNKKGFIIETLVPVVDGKFHVDGTTRNPTLIWVLDATGRLMTQIYAERGDKIKITGQTDRPSQWKIDGGSDLTTAYNEWINARAPLIEAGAANSINKEIAQYIKANADNKLSTLLLLTLYYQRNNESDYEKLWLSIDEDARSEDIIRAVTGLKEYNIETTSHPKIKKFKLHTGSDSIATIDPAQTKVTLIYFWRKQKNEKDQNIRNLKKLVELKGTTDFKIIDINLDADTMTWKNRLARDTVTWVRGWAIGGELNIELRQFRIPTTPYFILIDKQGNQILRTTEFNGIEPQLRAIIKK